MKGGYTAGTEARNRVPCGAGSTSVGQRMAVQAAGKGIMSADLSRIVLQAVE
jgi:hypothetical protein